MNDISLTGEGLSILINCKPISLHNTLAFASWYSIQKYLPDASVSIACAIEPNPWQSFGWVYRSKTRFFYCRPDADLQELVRTKFPNSKSWLVISPYVFAIREYNGILGPIPVKADQIATFVDCEDGCGKFKVADWINKMEVISLQKASRSFKTDDISLNESKVLSIWELSQQMYVVMQ